MCNRISGFKSHLGISSLAGTLLVVSHANAGALNGMDDPDRVPRQYIVNLKRDHVASLNNPVLTDKSELKRHIKSEQWRAADAAVDAEVAQIVSRLQKAHPNAKITTVMSHVPCFVVEDASDEEAKAIAEDDDVAVVNVNVIRKGNILN